MTESTGTGSPGREAAIRGLVDQANELQSDPDGFLALHTDDVSIVNVAGRRVQGAGVLGRAMREALTSNLARVITRVEVDQITFVRPDVALVSCTKHIDDQNEGGQGESFPTTARLTYLVTEDKGSWRIALAQTTPVGAAGG